MQHCLRNGHQLRLSLCPMRPIIGLPDTERNKVFHIDVVLRVKVCPVIVPCIALKHIYLGKFLFLFLIIRGPQNKELVVLVRRKHCLSQQGSQVMNETFGSNNVVID